MGSSGRLVEDLQRTLNARLKPSPELDIDGDFGPVTESAVLRFQQVAKLQQTGVVNEKVWQALGTLVTSDSPVPAPKVINSQTLETASADKLTGIPFITCKAWAAADAKTGKLLWSANENAALDIASTTKIMTACIVLREAMKAPDILGETVTFSQRADETRGSTAGVRAGEQLAVKELLYGLMLPSGNDASVALAEHFGARFAVGDSDDPLDRFVAEMNRTAAMLKMNGTQFRNPHGLTADGHKSTAADLVKLAHAALQVDRFRDYVRARQRGVTVVAKSGYSRNLVWKNTNRLLPIAGYHGVKTGTTRAAGACLVSCGERNNRELILVVLGSSSSDARYVDSRNLYRWAFSQLTEENSSN